MRKRRVKRVDMDDDDECPICYNEMKKPVTMSCGHSICVRCFPRCVLERSLSCPLCRQIVYDVSPALRSDVTLSVRCTKSQFLGISVANHPYGVEVIHLNPNDLGYRFLKVGTVLTHINNIPQLNHQDSVRLMDECREKEVSMTLSMWTEGTGSNFPFVRKIRRVFNIFKYRRRRAQIYEA